MNYEIQPFNLIGPIQLGMTRQAIHERLGEPLKFLKTKSDTSIPVDAYNKHGFHIYYDDDEKCEAIEMFDPAQVSFEKKKLIGTPYQEVKEYFVKKDEYLEEDKAGFTSKMLGIGVYAPLAGKEPQEPTEGVIVFRKGYYEEN